MIKLIDRIFCSHKWYYVTEEKVPSSLPGVMCLYTYIYCPRCKTEKKVPHRDWDRIKTKQMIQANFDNESVKISSVSKKGTSHIGEYISTAENIKNLREGKKED